MRTASTIVLAAVCASLTTAFALPLIAGVPATAHTADAEGDLAICDTGTLLRELLESDRYAPDIEAKQQELEDRITQLNQELQGQVKELEEQFVAAQESDDKEAMQALTEQYTAINQQMQQAQQQAQKELLDYRAEQFQKAFGEIAESAKGVGEELGFLYVASATPPEKEFEEQMPAELVLDVMARSFLSYPDGTDITEDVRDDLNL